MDGTVTIWNSRSLDPEELESAAMFNAVRLWSGFNWDDEGNVQALSEYDLQLIRQNLGRTDPLLRHQQEALSEIDAR